MSADADRPDTCLAQILHAWASKHPNKVLFTFVDGQGNPTQVLTYRQALRASEAVATSLGLPDGTRVLLVFPPGLDFIVAFLGCLTAGVVPVPVYPPNPTSLQADLPKLCHIAQDCQAAAVLTSSSYYRFALFTRAFDVAMCRRRWPTLQWIVTDRVAARAVAEDKKTGDDRSRRRDGLGDVVEHEPHVPVPEPSAVAFLQYTSGSTSDPKGVMVTHRALLHNIKLIARQLGRPEATLPPSTVEVSWLPQYHDMGLVGGYLVPLFIGASGFYMSPMSFLRNPLLWLRLISLHGGTHTQAPDFAYELCARRARACRASGSVVDRRVLEAIDLQSLLHVFNAADTVRAASMDAFQDAFSANGFDPKAFSPGYGLAENTVYVSDGGGTRFMLDRDALEREGRRAKGDMEMVGLGVPPAEVEVVVVDPGTRRRCPYDRVGEIWVRGASKAAGYWGRPELSRLAFQATITGEHAERGSDGAAAGRDCVDTGYLRTGDLGMLTRERGELIFVGRIKDIIVVRGRNIAPQDVERAVEAASRKQQPWWRRGLFSAEGTSSPLRATCLRRGGTVVFALTPRGGGDGGGRGGALQHIVFVGEVDTRANGTNGLHATPPEPPPPPVAVRKLAALIRKTVAEQFGVVVDAVMLLPPRRLPRTTSGKLRRQATRLAFENGTLESVSVYQDSLDESSPRRRRGVGAIQLASLEERAQLVCLYHGTERASSVEMLVSRFLEQRGIPPPVSGDVAAAGADSMALLELHEALQDDLNVDLPNSFLMDHKTTSSIAWGVSAVLPSPAIFKNSVGRGAAGTISHQPRTSSRATSGMAPLDNHWHSPLLGFPADPFEAIRSKRTCTMLVAAMAAVASYMSMVNRDIGWYNQPKELFEGYPGIRSKGWIPGRAMDIYHSYWIDWAVDDLPIIVAFALCGILVRRSISSISSKPAWRLRSRALCDALVGFLGIGYLHGAKLAIVVVLAGLNWIAVQTLCNRGVITVPGGARLQPLTIFTWAFAMLICISNHYCLGQTCTQVAASLQAPPTIVGWAKLVDSVYNAYPPSSRRHLPYTLRYMVMRIISFNMDLLEFAPPHEAPDEDGGADRRGLLAFAGYLFYWPLALHGPVIAHRNFRDQIVASISPPSTSRARKYVPQRILLGAFSGIINMAMLGLALHYFFYPSILFFAFDEDLLPWEWFFYGMVHLAFLYIGSSTMYRVGWTMALADGIETPDEMPADLMAATCNFRGLWSSYHRSWHQFFMRYIFFPVGGGYCGILLTVGFSLSLHGFGTYWLLWSGLNAIGFLLEKRLLSFGWYRQPGFLTRVANRATVIYAHMYPLEVFTASALKQLAWMVVAFSALYEAWGMCGCRCRAREIESKKKGE